MYIRTYIYRGGVHTYQSLMRSIDMRHETTYTIIRYPINVVRCVVKKGLFFKHHLLPLWGDYD